MKERVELLKEPEVVDDSRETVLSVQITHTAVMHAESLHQNKPEEILARAGERIRKSHLLLRIS